MDQVIDGRLDSWDFWGLQDVEEDLVYVFKDVAFGSGL